MAIVARMFVVLLAFLVACLVAAMVLSFGVMAHEWHDFAETAIMHGSLGIVVGLSAVIISGFALIPAFLVIAIAEGFRLRSVLFYMAIGGVLALAMTYGGDFGDLAVPRGETLIRGRELFA